MTDTRSAPVIVALCPTFRRPRLVGNAAACFLAQKVGGKRALLIWDDGGTLQPHHNGSIHVITSKRFPDLGSKYNALARLAISELDADFLAVWEDDDIYLPWYLAAHLEAVRITGRLWSKPSRVLSLYTGSLQEEPAAGRFHASIFLTREAWSLVKWPTHGRADFDQEFMARLLEECGPPADPLEVHPVPGYVFRYGSTKSYHSQHFMKGPGDTSWYQDVERTSSRPRTPEPLNIAFDRETAELISHPKSGQYHPNDAGGAGCRASTILT